MECEKVDSAHKSLFCLTAVPCQKQASVLLGLEFCWVICSLSVCDCRRSVGFTMGSYQVFLRWNLNKFSIVWDALLIWTPRTFIIFFVVFLETSQWEKVAFLLFILFLSIMTELNFFFESIFSFFQKLALQSLNFFKIYFRARWLFFPRMSMQNNRNKIILPYKVKWEHNP